MNNRFILHGDVLTRLSWLPLFTREPKKNGTAGLETPSTKIQAGFG